MINFELIGINRLNYIMNRTSYEFDVLVDPTKVATKDTAATTTSTTIEEVKTFNLTSVKITKTGVYDV